MGRRLDRIASYGGSLAAAVGLWDRFSAWRLERQAAKGEKLRRGDFERARRTEHELQRISDEANADQPPCPNEGCRRPKFHGGSHGSALKPWGTR